MEEQGWEVPATFAELESLCEAIQAEGMLPGIADARLTGGPFSAVFNLAKTSWLTTPEGVAWESRFLLGEADAAGMWEGTMDYVQRYMDLCMFTTDPEDRGNPELILDYLGNRKSVFCTAVQTVNITELPETGDQLGLMPYIGLDGSKNVYMYNPSSYFGISRRLTELPLAEAMLTTMGNIRATVPVLLTNAPMSAVPDMTSRKRRVSLFPPSFRSRAPIIFARPVLNMAPPTMNRPTIITTMGLAKPDNASCVVITPLTARTRSAHKATMSARIFPHTKKMAAIRRVARVIIMFCFTVKFMQS